MVENFDEWFHDILEQADITDSRYPIKGMAVWRPYGFQIRKHSMNIIKNLLDKDHDEVLFPMLVPESELAKEGIHVKGFEDEVYWVTKGGQRELNEQLALRPTSETAIYPMYSLWIRTHIDLGIPYLISKRPEWDKFPGSDYTMAFDVIMPNGKTLQIGTIHNLGQTFAKTFDITFEDKDGEHKLVYQTCAGVSDRVIASVIGIHGDDKGLRLPPKVSPNQVTIIPILFKKGKEEVLAKCAEIKEQLEAKGLRVNLDDRDIRPGKKFNDWELKGTPIKLELGPRDLENNITIAMSRDEEEKIEIALDDNLADNVVDLLNKSDENLSSQAWNFQEEHVKFANTLEEVPELVESGNVVKFYWCGEEEVGHEIEEKTGYDVLGIQEEVSEGKCIASGKDAKYIALIAKTY